MAENVKRTADYEDGKGNKAWVNLIKGGKAGLIAYVNINYDGYFVNEIPVHTKKDDEEDAYFRSPSKQMMVKGEPMKDENGKVLYRDIWGPSTRERRDELNEFIITAVAEKMAKESA